MLYGRHGDTVSKAGFVCQLRDGREVEVVVLLGERTAHVIEGGGKVMVVTVLPVDASPSFANYRYQGM